MGITIHYRGAIANLDRADDFEDRVLDLALELGGQARIWRTSCDSDPSRVVRGVLLDLCPGQETTSLLLSPEGWLIGLTDIEDAEDGKLKEMPWCFVKTQFGTLEGHVALAEMFIALKAEFFPDLEVEDEGDYWKTRDVNLLAQKLAFLNAAIKQFADSIEQYGLTEEAAEDPEILITRLTRIAALVQKTLRRPAEHPPVHWGDDDAWLDQDGPVSPEEEARWDASFKQNRRMQERVERAVEKHLSQGKEIGEALDAAMREETAAGLPQDEDDDREDWRASLPDGLFVEALDEDTLAEEGESFEAEPSGDGFGATEHHPLQQRATDLWMRLHDLLRHKTGTRGCAETLMTGVGDLCGGLAQALGDEEDALPTGLRVVQLKRSLRGAAFASGALFPLKADGLINDRVFKDVYATLRGLQNDIYDELRRLRASGD